MKHDYGRDARCATIVGDCEKPSEESRFNSRKDVTMTIRATVWRLAMAKAAALTALLVAFLAACDEANDYVEPPPTKVTVAQPLVREVVDHLEFTGTAETIAQVEVRARVPGILRAMTFKPGTRVAKGDPLFEIDPSEYEAEVAYAKAELARGDHLHTIVPHLLLVRPLIRPERSVNDRISIRESDADKVVEVLVGNSLNVKIHGRASQIPFRLASDVDSFVSNSARFERMEVLDACRMKPSRSLSRSESVR